MPTALRRPVEAFAVDDTSVQMVWHGATAGPVSVEVAGQVVTTDGTGGPGATVIDGLAADRTYRATVTFTGRAPTSLGFETLPALPGPQRCRIATVSDLHLGLRSFGMRYRIHDDSPGDSAGVRCGRSALAAAEAWGADLIVVKGDLTNSGRRSQWLQAAELLATVETPVVILPGNHEMTRRRTVEPWQAARDLGLRVIRGTESIDLPGIRIVLADTTIPGRSRGRIDNRTEAIVAAAADAPAALVMLHHHLEHRPDPFFWPPGVPRSQADPFLAELGSAQPAAFVTSGHTHRHKRRQVGPVTVTQVGSTKDYPGVWAGYTVHDSGIRQLVRRVADPSCLEWTEQTSAAMGGYWGFTSPGHLRDRCFSVEWANADGAAHG